MSEQKSTTLTCEWSACELTTGPVQCLNVVFLGKPSLGDITGLMKTINTLTEGVKDRYISVTDLRGLETQPFIRSIILHGMEKAYKYFLSVKNKSVLSFVILPESIRDTDLLVGTLKNINDADQKAKEYYRYFFIKDPAEVRKITEKVLPTIN